MSISTFTFSLLEELILSAVLLYGILGIGCLVDRTLGEAIVLIVSRKGLDVPVAVYRVVELVFGSRKLPLDLSVHAAYLASYLLLEPLSKLDL